MGFTSLFSPFFNRKLEVGKSGRHAALGDQLCLGRRFRNNYIMLNFIEDRGGTPCAHE